MEVMIMSKTFAYVRVSSKGQVINGQSIPLQCRKLLDYASKNNLQMHPSMTNSGSPGIHIDTGVSAWIRSPLFERPAFSNIMSHAAPGDKIICVRLDRAFRSVRDFCETWPAIDSMGMDMVFTEQNIDTSTAWGKCKAHILASFAQLKSDLISQRTIEGKAAKKAGLRMGRVSRDMLKMEVDPLFKIDRPPPADECRSGMGRVFNYARCSSWDQSVASQMPQLHAMMDVATEQGYNYGGTYADEGVSAYSVAWRNRPAGAALWNVLQPGDIVCISRSDRAFRSLSDMCGCWTKLKDMGVGLRIESSTGNAIHDEDECMMQIMVSMAELESKDMSARIREGVNMAVMKRGKRYQRSHVPWWQVIEAKRGKWKFGPNFRALSEFDEVLTLLNEGHTQVAAADIMEEKLSMRDQRCWLPDRATGVETKLFLRHSRTKYPAHWVKNLIRYGKEDIQRSNSKQDHIRRPWTSRRIMERLDSLDEIENLYSDSPEIKQQVEEYA